MPGSGVSPEPYWAGRWDTWCYLCNQVLGDQLLGRRGVQLGMFAVIIYMSANGNLLAVNDFALFSAKTLTPRETMSPHDAVSS